MGDVPNIDATLRRLVSACDTAFPNHDLSYYLIGSWADGAGTTLSDIDVVVVWTRGVPKEDDRVRGEAIAASLASPIRLDTFMVAEADVPVSLVGVNVKLSSRHLAGPDIRDRLPLPAMEEYTEQVVQGASFFMARILRGVEVLGDIDYPDTGDEFFGYAVKRIDAWYPAEMTAGLKEWVSTATRIARALVAIECHQYVGSKPEAIAAYHDQVGGEWGEYLSTLYRKGKTEWAYVSYRTRSINSWSAI